MIVSINYIPKELESIALSSSFICLTTKITYITKSSALVLCPFMNTLLLPREGLRGLIMVFFRAFCGYMNSVHCGASHLSILAAGHSVGVAEETGQGGSTWDA